VLVTGDGVCVDSGVAVARDRVGTLGGGDLVRAMRVVVRMIKGETGIGFGAVSDVGRIAVGDGGSDDRLGSFSPVSIAY
jgi:hypothetical protein